MLSKKLVRTIIYFSVVVLLITGLINLQRRNRLGIRPGSLFSSGGDDDGDEHEEYEPAENHVYLIDMKFKKCSRVLKSCSIEDNDTKGSNNIAWVKVNKSLFLKDKKKWNFDFSSYYLFTKVLNAKELKKDNYLAENFNKQNKFINQIVIYDPNSGSTKNEDQIPQHVIDDFNKKGESFSEMIMDNYEFTKSKLLGSEKKEKRDDAETKVPTLKELQELGWVKKEHGLWCKYGLYDQQNSLQEVDILYGEDAVDPRPSWYMLKVPLNVKDQEYQTFLTISNKKLRDTLKQYKKPVLKVHPNGKYKILQVADLHFSNGVGVCRDPFPESTTKDCKADPRTLKFVREVLEMEKPDFVILTGDQIFGETSPDALSSLLKALAIFIEYKIPFATTLGNHDDESSLTREQVMHITKQLPYSLSESGPDNVPGVGNYYLTVQGPRSSNPALLIWFLDTHKYSPNPKTNPGYDWIKENQLEWLENEYMNLKPAIAKYSHIHISMAFFHIPIPEFRDFKGNNIIGSTKEGVTAPGYNTGVRKVFSKLGVSVASVGHDHCNDYCLYDAADTNGKDNDMWLCYAGAAGEGGYGGYGGTARRVRVYEIDTNLNSISSWKRVEGDVDNYLDKQVLVDGGVALPN